MPLTPPTVEITGFHSFSQQYSLVPNMMTGTHTHTKLLFKNLINLDLTMIGSNECKISSIFYFQGKDVDDRPYKLMIKVYF